MELEYKVSYRKVKYPRLEFKTGGLLLILPYGEDPKTILEKHKDWIMKKSEFIKECLKNSLDKELVEREEKEFKKLVYSLVERTSKELGVKVKNIYFRKMKTKWASCSKKRNLTINILLKYLPECLIDYVIFHEIAHIIEKKHNKKFWSIVSKKFNYQELEKDLFGYWFVLGKKYKNSY